MPKTDYIKKQDAAFAAQLTAFKTNIGSYAAGLGVSDAQVTEQAADAAYFAYILACQEIAANHSQQRTAWKVLVRSGGSPPAGGVPVAPVFPAAVPAVAPGVELRFRALVKQIKAHATYNEAIGLALGIEGSEQVGPDFSALKPELELELSGAAVLVRWSWQGYSAHLDMIELVVDRSDGKGFVPLAFDTTPNYTDTAPLPSTPTKWTYRGIYRVADQRVGLWSNEVSLSVRA